MGFTEIMFIAIIAVVFLGPEKLPQAMVDIARFFKKIKGTIADTKEELERELQISDLKAEMLSYKSQLDDITNEVKDVTSGNIIKDEISGIQKSLGEINQDMNESVQAAAEPVREVITFEKKKTPIEKKEPANKDTKNEDA
ncbi:MAG: Sec-independent protein translocase protein TatB [Thiovulaceae bacterium]|nr:Sec-independent protein translocase protein TatB [Sulfurimonadaceae bacterium]